MFPPTTVSSKVTTELYLCGDVAPRPVDQLVQAMGLSGTRPLGKHRDERVAAFFWCALTGAWPEAGLDPPF